MRNRVVSGLAATGLSLVAASASAQATHGFNGDVSKIEAQVLAAFNAARTEPSRYAGALRAYRGFFRANIVSMPGSAIDFETEEGTVPVDEAISFLTAHTPLEGLESSDTLRQAALDHVREQGQSGRTGHFSADGSGPGDRNMKHGGGKQVAEVIAYGATDAVDVIRQLIVDDGVRDRGHRIVMYSDHLKYAGVACGPHPEFGTMCVIDMADTPDGKPGTIRRKVQVASAGGEPTNAR